MKQSVKYRIFRVEIVGNRFVDIGKGVKHSNKKVCRNVDVVRITQNRFIPRFNSSRPDLFPKNLIFFQKDLVYS